MKVRASLFLVYLFLPKDNFALFSPCPDLVFDDLDIVLGKFKHWAHRLYPKLPFNDVTDRIAVLGKKAGVKVYLQKVRSGMIDPSAQARMAAGGQVSDGEDEDNVAREGDLRREDEGGQGRGQRMEDDEDEPLRSVFGCHETSEQFSRKFRTF